METNLIQANEALRAENNRLKARLAQYRAQCDHAMTEWREYDRAKALREKLIWAVAMLAGGAVGAAAVCKLILWAEYLLTR